MTVLIVIIVILSFGIGLFAWWYWAEGILYKRLVTSKDKTLLTDEQIVSKYKKKIVTIPLVLSIIGIILTFFVGVLGFIVGPFSLSWLCVGIYNIWKD